MNLNFTTKDTKIDEGHEELLLQNFSSQAVPSNPFFVLFVNLRALRGNKTTTISQHCNVN